MGLKDWYLGSQLIIEKAKYCMAQQIKLQNVNVVSKDGECNLNISLELNINLTTDQIYAQNTNIKEEKKSDDDKVDWVIPDFTCEKVKLGKEVKIKEGEL